MWHDIAVAFCLVLVLEGIMPFVSPRSWRRAIISAVQLNDLSLRVMGLVSMILGVAMLYLVNG